MIPDRRRSHHTRRRRRAAVVALLAAGLVLPAAGTAAAAPGGAPAGPAAKAEAAVDYVTLVTGDRVRVTTRGGKQEATLVPDGSGRPAAAQLSGASTPVTSLLARYDDELYGLVSPWTDPHGRGSLGGSPGESVDWRLSAGGETVAEGEDPFLFTQLPAERAGYVLDVTGRREAAGGYALSTRVKGRWTFPSQQGAAGSFDPVPMLSLDAPLPLDVANSAPQGQAMTFTVSGRVLAKAQQLSSLSVASSGDGGTTWVPATVTRIGPDRFSVTVVNPGRAGTVSLRLAATAPGGLAVGEEVTAAYAVR